MTTAPTMIVIHNVFLLLVILSNCLIQGTITGNGSTFQCGISLCRQISSVYNKASLPHGYIQIATIPSGASNISIKEVRDSINILVLKTEDDHYIINGENEVSSSGIYEHGDNKFEYTRLDEPSYEDGSEVTEWIFALGPITQAIDLMVLIKDTNPGIAYEYFLPISTPSSIETDYNYDDSEWNELDAPLDLIKFHTKDEVQEVSNSQVTERKRRKYMWKIIGFGVCSKTCGGGIQNAIFRCIRDSPTRFFPPRRCVHIKKPILNENIYRCNTIPCPHYWDASTWKECRCVKGEGVQERSVRCVQQALNGNLVQSKKIATCSEPKPDETRKCDCPRLGRKRSNRPESILHQYSQLRVAPTTNTTHRRTVSNEKLGIWLTSEWNSHCSTECGSGFEHRSIFCDRTPPHSDRCDLRTTPDTARSCESELPCDSGDWFTARWGQCEGDCFNLKKKRQVFCVKNNVFVDDLECNVRQKPKSEASCSLDDVKYCMPRWHYSEWTQCSKSCGNGTQRRSVKCLELDPEENVMRESQSCRYVERQPVYSTCNIKECPDMVMDPEVHLIQNDRATFCDDIFPNCQIVMKAKMCSLAYYHRNCCFTCTGF